MTSSPVAMVLCLRSSALRAASVAGSGPGIWDSGAGAWDSGVSEAVIIQLWHC